MRRPLVLAAFACGFGLGHAAAQPSGTELPQLMEAGIGSVSPNAQSGGLAACDVTVGESGSVEGVALVQDVAPYGAELLRAVPTWRFEPARVGGRAAPSRVVVLWLARPPATAFAVPDNPRYKGTVAPDEIPWPTSIAVAPYPPNALGSGSVVLEADVSDQGRVTGTRRLSPATPFDGAAVDAARQWMFRPAKAASREVASRAVMVFSFVGTTP